MRLKSLILELLILCMETTRYQNNAHIIDVRFGPCGQYLTFV